MHPNTIVLSPRTKVLCISLILFFYVFVVGETKAQACSDIEIDAQIEKLSKGGSLRELAIETLSQCDSSTIPRLVQQVKQNQNPTIQRGIITSLSKMGSSSISSISKLLREQKINSEVRETAIISLIQISQEHIDQYKDVAASLLDRLKDKNEVKQIRISAVFYLGRDLGVKARSTASELIRFLKDRQEPEEIRYWTAVALTKIDPENKKTIDSITEVMRERKESWSIRIGFARLLGQMGGDARDAIPSLVQTLQEEALKSTSEGRNFHNTVIGSLAAIAEGTQDRAKKLEGKELEKVISNLEQALNIIQKEFENELKDVVPTQGWQSSEFERGLFIHEKVNSIRRVLQIYQARSTKEDNKLIEPIIKSKYFAPTIFVLTLAGFYFIILWWKPLLLLWLPDVSYIPVVKNMPIVKDIQLTSWLRYRERVLDEWVKNNIPYVMILPTSIEDSEIYIPLKVVLGNDVKSKSKPLILKPEHLRSIFNETRFCLQILGEGGAGKTSLAFQIANWCMAEEQNKRPSQHRMLPVWIEKELNQSNLISEIRDQIPRDKHGNFISDELIKVLLKKRRILLIIDRLSEMNNDAYETLRKTYLEFPINALIITSRIKEKNLGINNRSILKPQRIGGGDLFDFIKSYVDKYFENLKNNNKQNFHIDFQEYNIARRRLEEMTIRRQVTVLLAVLYAKLMIRDSNRDLEKKIYEEYSKRLPDNVRDLMLEYINMLNERVSEQKNDVIKTARIIGLSCINSNNYQPGYVSKELAISALEKTISTQNKRQEAEEIIEYFSNTLSLIEFDRSSQKIQFRLDPLAEYLAAIELIEVNQQNKDRWQEFIDSISSQIFPRDSVQGFLLALCDCCEVYQLKDAWKLPDNITSDLLTLADLPKDSVKQRRQQWRLRRLISDLKVSRNEKDIQYSVKEIGQLGEEAHNAIPELIKWLGAKDEISLDVRSALVKIGSKSVSALIQCLENRRPNVRSSAAQALGELGEVARDAVPDLIKALGDETQEVRNQAVIALNKIGSEDESAVQALLSLLNNRTEDVNIRINVTKALGAIAKGVETAVKELQKKVRDENENTQIRLMVLQALTYLGESVPSLIATIHENRLSLEIPSKSISTKFQKLNEDIVLEMVLIPRGSFLMGSPVSEEGRDKSEEPQHEVTIDNFFMSKYPITQAQWRVVASYPKIERDLVLEPSNFKDDASPVEMISWLDALEFCARLSIHTNQDYRMPSEAEWEYACRAKTSSPFHFGKTLTTDLANYCGVANNKNIKKYKGYYGQGALGNYRGLTTPVGSFGVTNTFGLCDMHGNIWEMCADPWHDDYLNAPISGDVWCSEDAKHHFRVMRGGSWNSDPKLCRSACRNLIGLEAPNNAIGFRICFSNH